MTIARALVMVAALSIGGSEATAQLSTPGATELARADSLLSYGDRGAARDAYREVLRRNPENSRALYQLATLLGAGTAEQVALFRSYVQLEPSDAWGHAALAESLAAAGEITLAIEAYDAALSLQPGEAEFVGPRADLQASFTRDGLPRRIRPEARLQLLVTTDSDANSLRLAAFSTAVALSASARLGLGINTLEAVAGAEQVSAFEGLLTSRWRSGPLRLEGESGLFTRRSQDPALDGETTPVLRLKGRYRPEEGPGLEMRLRHEPVSATPQLLATGVTVSEARVSIDVPLYRQLFARTVARAGRIAAGHDSNTRIAVGGGAGMRVGEISEIGLHYHDTRFGSPSDAGYFAPEAVPAVEIAGYTEQYGAWPLTLAIEGGAGLERVAEWAAAPSEWRPSFRLWSSIGWEFTGGSDLRLEIEAYDTRASSALSPESSAWRWGSVSTYVTLRR